MAQDFSSQVTQIITRSYVAPKAYYRQLYLNKSCTFCHVPESGGCHEMFGGFRVSM